MLPILGKWHLAFLSQNRIGVDSRKSRLWDRHSVQKFLRTYALSTPMPLAGKFGTAVKTQSLQFISFQACISPQVTHFSSCIQQMCMSDSVTLFMPKLITLSVGRSCKQPRGYCATTSSPFTPLRICQFGMSQWHIGVG